MNLSQKQKMDVVLERVQPAKALVGDLLEDKIVIAALMVEGMVTMEEASKYYSDWKRENDPGSEEFNEAVQEDVDDAESWYDKQHKEREG